ncbi:heme exporter protein CcmD [Phenylobacterium terrae]|uniref:Heme exporter protein D n=1 Tax=Phenylobacterium terrae TaxID=2665495 RepID=A0ABW4N144_9CAUL
MLDLDAGKYAAYVWPAFAVTAAVFAWMIASSLAKARRWRRRAEQRRDGRS